MEMPFVKYSGTGNDFVVFDDRELGFPENEVNLITSICDRHFGIGSDGLILIRNHRDYDFEMVFFNPDGSRSLCGNGSRCAVHYARELGLVEDYGRFVTTDGAHEFKFRANDLVSISMHDVMDVSRLENHHFVHTGSPHLIVETDDVNAVQIEKEGRALRNHPDFIQSGGTNVNFVKRRPDGSVDVRTYERGVEAETLSCGTGVTAVALALGSKDSGQNEISLHTKGGLLTVSYTNSEKGFTDIWLSGPVRKIFTGIYHA